MDSVSGVGVLDKSMMIVDAVHHGGALSLAELVEDTGLPRPTAHRLAAALEDHRVLRRDADGRYRLGMRLIGWGAAAGGEAGLLDAATPILIELRDRTGESVQLYVRDGDTRVCIASLERRQGGLRDAVPTGAVLPIERGSGGKALTEHVGAGGWAESVAEREEGVASVSAPVRDPSGRVLAAVSVSGPLARLGKAPGRKYGARVVAAARDMERRLGV
ncbi:MAG TPA: IclR family transcriptional regulator [Acidimicrobiia bacterium]|nr:IclR family transcriptional regulator [Acidimicrobiia bacterium]